MVHEGSTKIIVTHLRLQTHEIFQKSKNINAPGAMLLFFTYNSFIFNWFFFSFILHEKCFIRITFRNWPLKFNKEFYLLFAVYITLFVHLENILLILKSLKSSLLYIAKQNILIMYKCKKEWKHCTANLQ